jgi:hypothetical protein
MVLVLASFTMRLFAAEPVFKDTAIRLQFPQEIADLKFVNRGQYQVQPEPDPIHAYYLLYERPGMVLNIVVTEQGKVSKSDDGVKNFFLERELLKSYFALQKRPSVEDLEHGEMQIALENTPVPFMSRSFRYNVVNQNDPKKGGPSVGEDYATVFRHHFVRVSADYWRADSESARETLLKALKAVQAMIIEARKEPEKPKFGTATREADGTIIVQLRTTGTAAPTGDGRQVYPPSHPDYEKIRKHIGPIETGSSVTVRPWPEDK